MINVELSVDPEIFPVGLHPREMETCPYRNLNMSVHSSQKVEMTQMSIQHLTNGWTKRGVYIQWHIIQPKTIEEIPKHVTVWMNLENTIARDVKVTCCVVPVYKTSE